MSDPNLNDASESVESVVDELEIVQVRYLPLATGVADNQTSAG